MDTVLRRSDCARLVIVGGDDGKVRALEISEHLKPSEVDRLLAHFAEATVIDEAPTLAVYHEDDTQRVVRRTVLEVQKYAYRIGDGEPVSVRAAFDPQTRRWYVARRLPRA